MERALDRTNGPANFSKIRKKIVALRGLRGRGKKEGIWLSLAIVVTCAAVLQGSMIGQLTAQILNKLAITRKYNRAATGASERQHSRLDKPWCWRAWRE